MTDQELLEEAKQEHKIILYNDDSDYLYNNVLDYNNRIKEKRRKRDKFKRFEAAFIKVNVTLIILLACPLPFVVKGIIGAFVRLFIAAALVAVAYIVFIGNGFSLLILKVPLKKLYTPKISRAIIKYLSVFII